MNEESGIPPAEERSSLVAGIVARVGTIAFFIILQAVILFLAAGRLSWTWAWVYLGICLVSVAINGVIMLRTSPETIAERGRPQATQNWDKVIGGLWALLLYLILPLVAGLDTRFGWTQALGAAWNLAGAVVLAAGLGLGGWAMIANAYFSTAVRIQSDRGQTVCRSGPYRFVIHPGYVGFILQSLSTPILLGSLWALIPGLIAAFDQRSRQHLQLGALRDQNADQVRHPQQHQFPWPQRRKADRPCRNGTTRTRPKKSSAPKPWIRPLNTIAGPHNGGFHRSPDTRPCRFASLAAFEHTIICAPPSLSRRRYRVDHEDRYDSKAAATCRHGWHTRPLDSRWLAAG